MNVQIRSEKGFELTEEGKKIGRIAYKYSDEYTQNVTKQYLCSVPKSWIDKGYVKERG